MTRCSVAPGTVRGGALDAILFPLCRGGFEREYVCVCGGRLPFSLPFPMRVLGHTQHTARSAPQVEARSSFLRISSPVLSSPSQKQQPGPPGEEGSQQGTHHFLSCDRTKPAVLVSVTLAVWSQAWYLDWELGLTGSWHRPPIYLLSSSSVRTLPRASQSKDCCS